MYKSTQEVKLGSDFATICFCVYICLKVHQTFLMYSPSLSAWFPLNMPFKCDFPSVAVPFRYFFSGSACRIYSLASSFLQNSPYKCSSSSTSSHILPSQEVPYTVLAFKCALLHSLMYSSANNNAPSLEFPITALHLLLNSHLHSTLQNELIADPS